MQKWSEAPRGQTLFDSILVFENYPVETTLQQFQEVLEIRDVYFKDPSHYPLTLMVACREQLSIRITYDSAHFDDETVLRILEDFKSVLSSLKTKPKVTLRELSEALQDSASNQRRMKANELEAKRLEKLKYTKRIPIRKKIEEDRDDGKRDE